MENVGNRGSEEVVAQWLFRSHPGSQPVPLTLQQKPRSILSKYDEELEGEQPHSFRLEQGGMADGLRERELEEIRAKLRLQAQSLSTVGPRLASEYLTPEEMVSPLAPCTRGHDSPSPWGSCAARRHWEERASICVHKALGLVGKQ